MVLRNSDIKAELIDITSQTFEFHKHAFEGYNVKWVEQDSLTCEANQFDMTLIDSLHHYKHVNRELLRYENT